MCGLVGVIGDLFVADRKAFKFMLELDTVRGPHSTGIARITADFPKKVEICKDVGTPWDLQRLNQEEFFNHEKETGHIHGNLIGLMGHNRWATVGKVTPDNAHPFLAGKIVGAQNGTLPHYQRTKLDDWEMFDTDTEALIHNIDKHGAEAVIPRIDGAWALTWYNKEDDTFNILRNVERPLVYAWKKGGKVLYYASEAWMIYAATEKFNIDIENDQVYKFEKDFLYSWKLGTCAQFSKAVGTSKPLKGYVTPPVDYSKWKTSTAASSANVFTGGGSFTGNFSDQHSEWSKISYWFKKIGQEVEFTPLICLRTDDQKKQYLPCLTRNGHQNVRIYTEGLSAAHTMLLEDFNIQSLSAKIRKVKAQKGGGFYLLIDKDTLTPVEVKKAAQSDLFTSSDTMMIANGKVIEPDEYDRKVAVGCAWCTHTPSREDAGHLHWFNETDFLCADCAVNEEVLQYIPELVKVS
jgi:hypothetical protein